MKKAERLAVHIAIGATAIFTAGQAPDGSQLKAMSETAGVLAVLTATLEVASHND